MPAREPPRKAGHYTHATCSVKRRLTVLRRPGIAALAFRQGHDDAPERADLLIGQLGNIHNHFDFNLTSANGIGIQFGPDGYNVGIDNVSFAVDRVVDGGVPEPASWALMLLGFAGLGAVMRRRRLAPVAA